MDGIYKIKGKMGTAINKHRQLEKEKVDTYGFKSRGELRKAEKEAKREESEAEENFEIIKKFIKDSVTGIYLLHNIKGVRFEEFFHESILMMDFYIDGDAEKASELEDTFDIFMYDSGMDLNDILEVHFFSKDETHEDLIETLESNKVVSADELLNDIGETIKRIES